MVVKGIAWLSILIKDVEKLEKFMIGKPIAEQEIGQALLQDIVAYAETSSSRRKIYLTLLW